MVSSLPPVKYVLSLQVIVISVDIKNENEQANRGQTGQRDSLSASHGAKAKNPLGPIAKRATDLLLSLCALIPGAVVMGIAAIAIKLDSPGPVIFTQKRFGKNGEFFNIYKFRTMNVGTPNLPTDEMQKLPSPITRVGGFLRRSSLDELPQLFNVLKGEMSIVGPRPALYNQTELTAKREAAGVLRFPPGITGWAQVNGRDELADDIKVEFDRWYCDNWNYWLDWKIIFSTIQAVASRRGAK